MVLRKPVKGQLREFVIAHADRTATQLGPKSDEVERLLGLLNAAGIKSTHESVAESIRVFVKRRDGKPPTKTRWKPGASMAPVVMPPPAVAKPTVEKHTEDIKSMGKHAAVGTTPDQLLVAVMEAEKYCDDMKAAAELLGTLLPRLRKEIERFKEQQRRARELFQLD